MTDDFAANDTKEGVTTPLEKGHYYRKQIGCKCGVIAWSHRSRFDTGLKLIGASPRRLLDYGCGDGTFLALAEDRLAEGCGADIAKNQVEDCQTRFAESAKLKFCTTDELGDSRFNASFDVVTCMETLEHCLDSVVDAVLRDLARLVAANGRVVISVPIETGPTFLIKLVVRKIAGWTGQNDYRYYESYSLSNAVRMIFAGKTMALQRPVYGGEGAGSYSHYGFNWRAMRERVRSYFAIEKTCFSPLGFVRGWVSSQAWFVCRLPPARRP